MEFKNLTEGYVETLKEEGKCSFFFARNWAKTPTPAKVLQEWEKISRSLAGEKTPTEEWTELLGAWREAKHQLHILVSARGDNSFLDEELADLDAAEKTYLELDEKIQVARQKEVELAEQVRQHPMYSMVTCNGRIAIE